MITIHELQTYDHVLSIVELTARFVKEAGHAHGEYDLDPDVLVRNCFICIDDTERKHLNCWLAYNNNTPIGFLVGTCTQNLYNKQLIADQKLWYTIPESRGSKAPLLLMKKFEDWARLQGASTIYTGVVYMPNNSEKISKLLTKLGYPMVGTIHKKETVE